MGSALKKSDTLTFTCVVGVDESEEGGLPGFTREMSDLIFHPNGCPRIEGQTWQALRETVDENTNIRFEFELSPEAEEQARQDEESSSGDLCAMFDLGQIPPLVHSALIAIASSGITVTALKILKLWVDTRNGRKLKIKVGDIEVESTQLKEADVLRIFDLLQEKADRQKIRELLIGAGTQQGTNPSLTNQ